MSFDTFLQQEIVRLRTANIKAAQTNPTTINDFDKKLQTLAEKLGQPVSYVALKIRTDPEWAALIAKDPKKQNPTEAALAAYLTRTHGICVEKLPASGAAAVHLIEGVIVEGQQSDAKTSKSIDFTWTANGKTAYMAHKYTHESGGAQDNQREELRRFMASARSCRRPSIVLYAGCDGAYYQQPKIWEPGSESETFAQYVNRRFGTANAFAGTTDEIVEHWQAYIV